MQFFAVITFLFFTHQAAAAEPVKGAAANRLLLTEVFQQEYFTVMAGQKEEKARWDFYLSQEGLELLVRATLITPAKIPGFNKALLRMQRQHLKELGKLKSNKLALRFLKVKDQTPFSAQHSKLILETFKTAASRSAWTRFAATLESPSACKELASEGDVSKLSDKELLSIVTKQDEASVACMSEKMREPYKVLKLLNDVNHSLADTETIRSMYTTELLKRGLYPQALRQLIALSQENTHYKFVYSQVQRIFSFQQRGDGTVALRQSL